MWRTIWQKHRTKTLGVAAMLIGAAQANFESVRNLIPQQDRGIILFCFGMLAAIIGFINSGKDDAPQ